MPTTKVTADGTTLFVDHRRTRKQAQRSPKKMRGVHAFESPGDGSLVIYATMPDGDGEPIRIEPHRVRAVIQACLDALGHERNTY